MQCAIVIKVEDQHYTYTHVLGEMDNHTAEWAACIYALKHARELNVSNALLYTDSKLIADSVNAGYVKNAKFKPYFDQLEIFEQDFDLLFVKWIPREQNKEANQYAQQALYKLIKKHK
ncbi:ribonuclease HI family protein [Staphylococcus aureus]|nr:ribonuclease HI family protein [Staphylococcus aureus]